VADLNNQTSTPLRVLWSSNALWSKTGYGNQTALFIPRLARMGHTMGHVAFYGLEGGSLNTPDAVVYPKMRDGYGNDAVQMHSRHFKPDVVITLIDAWVLQPQSVPEPAAWAPWFPIDMEPIPPPVLRAVQHAHTPIVYSRFGMAMAHAANLDARYVPHGVDTALMRPTSRKEARAALGWPDDRFVFGMVAANKGFPSRKALPAHLEAFAHFARKHPDALLYVHTHSGTEQGGVNVPELAAALGISDRVLFPDQYGYTVGFPDAHMVTLYNAMDTLLSVSMGEGFGIPILEAQACGTPVIVGDWTSMAELCLGGWKVAKEQTKVSGYGWIPEREWTPLASYQFSPRTGAILEAMEAAYGNPIARERKGREAREGALAYDADRVAAEHWRPVLDEIAQRIGKEVAA
jgi:glycosyltransferase involved in cell wall biosynthesis